MDLRIYPQSLESLIEPSIRPNQQNPFDKTTLQDDLSANEDMFLTQRHTKPHGENRKLTHDIV